METFDDFSEDEWDKIYNTVLKACIDRQKAKVSLKLEIIIDAPSRTELKELKKRAIEMTSSDLLESEQSSPKARYTRIDALLGRERNRAEALANAGNFEQDLLEKWNCNDDRCRNLRGYCFVDYNGRHYNMNLNQQKSWAKTIVNEDLNISFIYPPRSLYIFWTQRQDVVIDESRKPIQQFERQESKDMMTRFMDFSKQQMDMRMQEMMMKQMDRAQQRQAIYRSFSLPPPPPPFLYPEYQSQQYSLHHHSPPPPPPVSLIAAIIISSQRRSSPIGHPDEKDRIIQEFFR